MPTSSKGVKSQRRRPPAKSTKLSLATKKADSQDLSASAIPKPSTAMLEPAEARVARALWKFQIPESVWKASPEITPIIWRTMGNQKKAMENLRFSEDEDVKELLKIYYAMTQDEQEKLPLEIPCLAAKVSPWHILGQLVTAYKDVSRMESALILIGENPEILRASAAFGKALPSAVKDREMILKATGTLPSPAGQSINLNFGQQKEQDYGPEVDPEDSDLESDVFNYDTKTIDGWGEDRRKLMDTDKRK